MGSTTKIQPPWFSDYSRVRGATFARLGPEYGAVSAPQAASRRPCQELADVLIRTRHWTDQLRGNRKGVELESPARVGGLHHRYVWKAAA